MDKLRFSEKKGESYDRNTSHFVCLSMYGSFLKKYVANHIPNMHSAFCFSKGIQENWDVRRNCTMSLAWETTAIGYDNMLVLLLFPMKKTLKLRKKRRVPILSLSTLLLYPRYHQVSNIRRTLVSNKIVDHSDIVGASPVGAAPTTSSFST